MSEYPKWILNGKEITPEEQRIAIAEACGWTSVTASRSRRYDDSSGVCPPSRRWPKGSLKPLPNYLNDLNAMHKAEKLLKMDGNEECEWAQYQETLWYLVNPEIPFSEDNLTDVDYLRKFMSASASQRAEAFLRTINKWKD